MYETGAGWWAGPGVKQTGLLESSADPVQHFAVLGHGLSQILHHSVLHKNYLQKWVEKNERWELAADAVQHLAVVGHGLNQVLHNDVLHK